MFDFFQKIKNRLKKRTVNVHSLPLKHDRATWVETWMQIARTIAEMRSYDPRLKVGAIIVTADNTRMLSLGYNGSACGMPNVPESLEPGKSGFVHAEINCCIKCDYHVTQDKVMYVTHSPCLDCAKVLLNANIKCVVYDQPYRDMSGVELLKSAGVAVYSVEEAIVIERHGKATGR